MENEEKKEEWIVIKFSSQRIQRERERERERMRKRALNPFKNIKEKERTRLYSIF